MTIRRSLLIGIWGVCAVVFVAAIAVNVKRLVTKTDNGGTYLVGTFEGTFSVARKRVVVYDPQATGLVVARLDDDGEAAWNLAYAGLARGRAVEHLLQADSTVLVTGVFEDRLRYGKPPQETTVLQTEQAQAVFVIVFGSNGRLVSTRAVAEGDYFTTPSIKVTDTHVMLEVAYKGKATVDGKPVPEAAQETTLLIQLSPSQQVERWEVAPPPLQGAAPKTKTLTTCNICRNSAPRTDPNCADCRHIPSGGGVCSIDNWCCTTGWDWQCQDEGISLCPTFPCTCVHGPYTTGEYLHHGCNAGNSHDTNCVTTVCSLDHPCEVTTWDSYCVGDTTNCP